MGRDFIATTSNSSEIGAKKRMINKRISIGPKASRFIAVIVFAALGILYLTQSTQGADRSYKIQDLTAKKSQLLEERDRLKIEESRLESLNEIDKTLIPQQEEGKQMEPVSSVNYLSNDQIAAVK